MHRLAASFVLGYHGCDREVGEKLLRNDPFALSANDYDWLGSGIYFWEANPDRALEWAQEHLSRLYRKDGKERKPFVVGAVIDLGFCLDLLSTNGIKAVEKNYMDFKAVIASTRTPMPTNKGGDDLVFRRLDRAVLEFLHESRRLSDEPSFDTVRGVFTEGEHIYPNSGFRRKTHIQICVRNSEVIKGVFRVADRHFTS